MGFSLEAAEGPAALSSTKPHEECIHFRTLGRAKGTKAAGKHLVGVAATVFQESHEVREGPSPNRKDVGET